MRVPFSCFHLVKENVYPAALLLIRGHCPRGAGKTETEGERLLCSMRGIHRVLNWNIVTTGYCFSNKKEKKKYWMFSYSRHLPPTGCSVTQRMFFPPLFRETQRLIQTALKNCNLTHSVLIWKQSKYQCYRTWPCYHTIPAFILQDMSEFVWTKHKYWQPWTVEFPAYKLTPFLSLFFFFLPGRKKRENSRAPRVIMTFRDSSM